MIKILCVGSLKEKFYTQAVNEYVKRLKKYTKLQIIELDDESIGTTEQIINKESKKILEHIKEEDFTILLDLKGITVDSLEFAERLRKLSWQYKNTVFIIGGSYGVTEEVRESVKVVMAFSKLTFPHQLFRVILLEQIYRAFRINSNESYHK